MKLISEGISALQASKTYLYQLDLTYIVNLMCSKSYPLPRWRRVDAEQCALLYKNFMYLQLKHPSLALVPSKSIDEFWHNHILHTKKYMQDCEKIFGFYLHHEPAESTDEQSLVNAYILTKQLYFAEFNQPLL